MAADPNVLSTLRRRRDVIEGIIAQYEAKLDQARQDLVHLNATMELFASDRDPGEVSAYMDMNRVFRRGEIVKLCKAALEAEGELDTRELAVRVMRARQFDPADNVLRKRVAYRIVQALTLHLRRGTIASAGKRANVRLWRLAQARLG